MSPVLTRNIEFHVEISQGHVRGLVGEPPVNFPIEVLESELDIDPLLLDSARLLEQWLNGWDLIHRSQNRPEVVLKPDAFRLLGQLLWRLVLADRDANDNEVGKKLRETVMAADRDSPVRLVISFDDTADATLRGLPWEFLSMRVGNEDRFLAAETAMLLTRYIQRGDDRTTVKSATGELRVQFVAAVPEQAGDLANAVLAMSRLARAVKSVQGVVVNDPIDHWDSQAIRDALSDRQKPCQIVHVVGVCRGVPGQPEMFLADEEGQGAWMDPKPLVDALTPDGAERPQLVILQLCDYKDGDASENFERLAPRLIERNVPAVLATQYAGTADDVGVGAQFYERLYKREKIGEAVQNTRHEMLEGKPLNRQFGTPVLYLQADGPLLGAVRVQSSTSGAGQSQRSTPITNETIRAVMLQALDNDQTLPTAEKQPIEQWLMEQDFSNQLEAARNRLQFQIRVGNPRMKQVFKNMLEELKRLDPGSSDARP